MGGPDGAAAIKLNEMVIKKRRWHCLPGQPLTDLDKQVMFWENKGKLVPTRDLIKTPEQIEGIRKSGVVNTGCLDSVAEAIRPGMNTQEIDDICMQYCKDHDAIPACLNYEGYPKSVCTSINEVVCHGIPKEEDVLQEGDIVNVDCSTILNGYFSDSSRMFCIGEVSEEKKKLVDVTKECMLKGLEMVKPWNFLGDMAQVINDHAKANGYSVVVEIGGHGIGLEFHEEPFVSYVTKAGTEMLMVPGMVFTIEPMVNMGTSEVYVDDEDGWTVYTEDGKPSAQWEHTLLMTEHGVEILSH